MRKHWKKIVGISLGVLVILILLAPMIAVKSGYVARLINEKAGINGTIEFDSASLNWFSRIKFHNVTIRDEQGQAAATVGTLSISRNLTGLILFGMTEAEIGVENCQVTVDRQGDELNWLKILPEKDSDESSTPLHLRIKLNEAEVIFQENAESVGSISGLGGDINFLPVGTLGDEQMIGLLLKDANDLDVQSTLQFDQSGDLLSVQSTVESKKTDLSTFNPVLDYLDLPQLTMRISGRTSIRWNPTYNSFTLNAEFENVLIEQLSPDQKQMVEGFPVVPSKISGSIAFNSRLPSGFQFETDYGQISFDGVLPTLEPPYFDTDPDSRMRMEASLDLAKFAREHPDWVQVREGVELQQGMIILTAFNRMEGDKQRMLVDLRADQLLAKRNEQTIEWKNPVSFSVALARKPGEESVELEFVECKSDFLNIQGSGGVTENGSNGKVDIQGDLALLKQKLDDFFDLGSFQLEGLINGNLNWNTAPVAEETKSFQLQSDSTIRDFNLGFSDEEGWHEKLMNLRVNMDCKLDQGSLSQISKLNSKLSIDNEAAIFVLRKPVEFVNDYQAIFDADLHGSSRNWMRRLNSLVDTGIDMSGDAGLSAVVSATPKFVRIRSRQCTMRPFRMQVSNMNFNEPNAKAQLDLVYSRKDGSIKANEMQLTSTNFLINSNQFQSSIKDSDRITSGDFQVSGNAQKLSNWFLPESLLARGSIEGNLQIRVDNKGVHWNSKIDSEKFDLQQRTRNELTQKSKLDELIPSGPATLKGSGSYSNGKIELEKTTLAATQSEIELSGSIDLSAEHPTLDLAGKLKTDLQELITFFAPYIAPEILFSGGRESEFRVTGPITDSLTSTLIPTELAGSADLRWDKGEVFALPVEKGALQLKLANSEILIQPQNLKIANGDLVVAPRLVLRKEPYTLVVPAGTMIRNADIGPKVFRTWMRYLTPLLADATSARGQFSVELNQTSTLPLENPLTGSLNGKMSISSVTVGPGPSGESLISMLQQILAIVGKGELLSSLKDKPWLALPTQEINVEIDGGKVAHELLQFRIGEVNIYTSGSVDMNQNINMVVVVPIKPDWFKDRPILKTVIGDAIQIPLKGNLANPKLDLELLKGLSKRLAAGAVEKLIDGQAGGLLKNELLKNIPFKAEGEKGKLGKFFEDKAQDLLKKGILKGLDKLNKKK